jgi:hypothetical protein
MFSETLGRTSATLISLCILSRTRAGYVNYNAVHSDTITGSTLALAASRIRWNSGNWPVSFSSLREPTSLFQLAVGTENSSHTILLVYHLAAQLQAPPVRLLTSIILACHANMWYS